MQNKDGFYFHSLPSASGETRSLIVILHGHASHPDKYMKWAKKTQTENPDADIIIVRAPLALKATDEQKIARNLAGADDLYTWYGMEKKPSKQVGLMLKHAFNRLKILDKLNTLVDNELAERGLKDKDLAFIGFSMGGAVSVQAALRRKEDCAAVVCHSGTVLPFTKVKRKPDTLMIIGDKDDLFYNTKKKLPQKASRILKAFHGAGIRIDLHHEKSVKRLKKGGIKVEEKIVENQDHRITEDSWHEASVFVAKKLKLKK